jgi:hypothetical protein
MDRSGEIEFKLLGPLEVRGGSGPVALGPPQQRALLALGSELPKDLPV